MSELDGKQRKYLRGLAHSLEPKAHVGKHGLSEAFLASLDQTLEHHELVKVKFLEHRSRKAELIAEMEAELRCTCVGKIGHLAILYREARVPEHREIRLPPSKATSPQPAARPEPGRAGR